MPNGLTIPNILSGLRLMLVPVLLVLAAGGYEKSFIVLLAIAFLTDALDGFIARHFHQKTLIGAKLDSWGDFAVYMTIPVAGWLLWPDIIIRERLYVGMIVVSILLPVGVGLLKFKVLTNYHTWLVKFAVIFMAVTSMYLFLGGPPLPFQIASLICLLAGLEEMLITLVLPAPQANVRSLWHVLQAYRANNESNVE